MALSANILPNPELQNLLDETKSLTNTTRFIRVNLSAKNNSLILSETAPNTGEPDEEEFTTNLEKVLKPDTPQYILFQKDDKLWIMISYVPDSSSRTEKMLYASCMGSLKSSFNSGRISHTFTINDDSEMKWSYFRKQYFEINKEELMSVREKALAESRVGEEESRREAIQAQANLVQRLNTQNTGGGGGVTFPFSDEAKQAINDYLDDSINYCRFKLHIKTETVNLDQTGKTFTPAEMTKTIPSDCITFNLYKFIHESETHNIFAFCRPNAMQLSIKDRMLNASSKNATISLLKEQGVEIGHCLEIDDGEELCEKDLINRVAPNLEDKKGFVTKPRGPGRRGARPPRTSKPTGGVNVMDF